MNERELFWQRFTANRQLTMRLLEVFPKQELFNYQPTSHLRAFAEIANEILWLETAVFAGIAYGTWNLTDEQPKPSHKNELLAAYHQCHLTSEQLFAGVSQDRFDSSEPDPWSGQLSTIRSRLEGMLEHEIHHRGQGYIYLRLLEIEPPDFWTR